MTGSSSPRTVGLSDIWTWFWVFIGFLVLQAQIFSLEKRIKALEAERYVIEVKAIEAEEDPFK